MNQRLGLVPHYEKISLKNRLFDHSYLALILRPLTRPLKHCSCTPYEIGNISGEGRRGWEGGFVKV